MAKKESILLRVSEKEKEFIRREAQKKGMNMTEYIFGVSIYIIRIR